MNADSRKRVGETAPTGVLASESGGEPDQKCESPQTTVKTEKNMKVETQEPNANGSSKNLDTDSTESTSGKSAVKDIESFPIKVEKVDDESHENVNTDKGSAKSNDIVSTQKASSSQSSSDPYAYVDRGDFTSEKFKIEIRGFPKFYGYGELKRFLNTKLKLSSHKVKLTRKKSPWIFVCFKNEEDRQAAIKTLNRVTWKGKMLTASMAKPAPDPLVKKRKLQDESGSPEKKPRISDDERLKNSTTPYWNLEYEEQLQKKYDYVKGIMCNLANLITNVNPMLSSWVKRQKSKYNGMICNLLDIRKSPICDGYRNKCEFTVGINEETKQRMVGFRLGSYVQGQVGVGPIDSLKHIPQRMKETVKVFEKFIQSSSKEPFNPETHTGHWRLLTLRLTTIGELMVVVVVNSKGKTKEELAESKEEVKEFFENGDGKVLKVDSLYYQAVGKRESGKEPPPMEHLLGATHITEELLGLKFRISPEAFFQVNTPGAGVLYSSVGELIDLTPSTTLVDVCCGTGTIGLSLAKKCGQVLGLEVVAPAIEDAKVNANVNNITNCEFFTGRAEEILTSVLTRAKGKSVYAIVDPPRSGLQQKGIIALRAAEVVDKIVYVSCDPNAALKNFVDLARQTSKTYHGLPLVPICAVPVDMFPHTAHCELVLLFHRVNPINLPKSMPPSKDDVALLTKSLADPPPLEPNAQVPERKDDKGVEKGKPLSSDSKNTMSSNKSSLSSSDGPQGKKFRRVISGDIHKDKYKQMGRHLPVKSIGNKSFSQPKSNSFQRNRLSRSEQQRALRQSFSQDRSTKFSRPGRTDKNPSPWLHNERNKWKENESLSDRNAGLWKDGPSSLMPEGMRGGEDMRYGGSRSGWKEDRPLERENRGWSGNQPPSESRWHEMGRRRDDLGPSEEPRRRDEWKRDDRNEAVPSTRRWRDEEVELPSVEMLGRRKLEREVEQLLASRRVCLEERQHLYSRDDDNTNWSQPGNHRQPDSYSVTEPRWAERGMDRTVEDERMRMDRERSPIRGISPVQGSHMYERQLSPVCKRVETPPYKRYSSPVRKRQESPIYERRETWCERRISREDMADPVDFRGRFQELDDKMPMREGLEDRLWDDRAGYTSVEFEDKPSYRVGRDSDDMNVMNEPPGFRVRDYGSRRSPGICDRELKPEFNEVYPERMEIRVGGNGYESPKHSYAVQERGGVSMRQTEQTNLRPPYAETQPFSPRDKISSSGRLSPDRISSRFDDAGRSYRGSDPDNFRGPNDVPPTRFSKGENLVPDRYLSSKERNVNFERNYESNFQAQGFSSFEETRSKTNVGKADLISRPISSDEQYRSKGHDSREIRAPDDFIPNQRGRGYPVDGPKSIHHREPATRLGGWNEPVLGRRRSPSPARFNERNDDRYTHRNFADESDEPWTRNRDQDEVADWRMKADKDRSDKRYTTRDKPVMPEARDSNHNYSMPNRYSRSPRRETKSRFRDKDSPPKIEKFSFPLPRVSLTQNVQKSEDNNRIPALNFYSSNTSNQLPYVPSIVMESSAATLNPVKQMNSKHFGNTTLAQNMGFDNPSFQGSQKLKPLDYNPQGPSQPQVPLGNFRQPAFTSTTGVISPWNNVGVSPWDRTHNQAW